jgi:hypothetical protein
MEMGLNSSNAHDVGMPARNRAAAIAPTGRGAPIGYVFVIDGVRSSSVALKEGET